MKKTDRIAPFGTGAPTFFSIHPFAVFSLCILGILLVLFHRSLDPRDILFSNDGPLGANMAQATHLPAAFKGVWYDLNLIGTGGGTAQPNITQALFWVLGPMGFAKFYVPLVLTVLGLGAWAFFRQIKLAIAACLLASLAVVLNSTFFSAACWGVGPQAICFGMNYLGLAALNLRIPRLPWLRFVLAGLGVGLGVMEGLDIGAIFSLCFAAYVLYSALVEELPLGKAIVRGVGGVALVAVFAAFIAAQTLNVMIGTQIKGISGTKQDSQTKAEHWDWATQWSLPKRETLSLIVPGLFGFRMDSPDGGNYWGAVGRDPNWDRYYRAVDSGRVVPGSVVTFTFPGAPDLNTARYVPTDGKLTLPGIGEINVKNKPTAELEQELVQRYGPRLPAKQASIGFQAPQGFMRFSGGGCYAGVPVVLIALWAALQALRRKDSVFSLDQRKLLWFWMAVVVVSLLLAFGRFAPFYQFLYALPYFSTIRNPGKFIHVLTFALLILFGYGVDGLWRRYMAVPSTGAAGLGGRFKTWWARATVFDRRWVVGCLVALAASVVGWLVYGSSRASLEQYLQTVQFDETMAHAIAAFSIARAGWFVLFFVLGAGLLALILSGVFSGSRAKIGATLLGILLVVDLGLANLPWIMHWDYQQKYATNPILEELRERPYEHRVALLPFRPPPQLSMFNDLYKIEWAQHTFLYYNIQSLDIIQMSRMPEDLAAFEGALHFDGSSNTLHHIARRWQLTNTRYLLGPAVYLDTLNRDLDPLQHRFRIAAAFDIAYKPGVARPTKLEELTVVPRPDGPYALFEFAGVLPRAKLYCNWQVNTNDNATLEQLASPAFNPETTVFVAGGAPAPQVPGTNQNAGTVEFANYSPRDFVLKANAAAPSVLLVNDRFDPDWKVWVDGKPAPVLRCNFIMRGVFLAPGAHQVEFRFQPAMNAFYISLAAIILGLLLCGVLVVSRERGGQEPREPALPSAKPAEPAKAAARK